MNLVDNFL